MYFHKELIQLFLFCFTTVTYAQYQITIDAVLLDNHSKKQIPYASIKFKGTDIKTITNNKGEFSLSYNEASIRNDDLILISAQDYVSIEVTAEKLYKLLKNSAKIYLKPLSLGSDLANTVYVESNLNGKIISNKKPLQGASINIKNTLIEAQTDFDGSFTISANLDDVLIISFLGMKTKEIIIKNNDFITIELENDGEILEEVLLKGKAKKEELIDLGVGRLKSFDAIGYATNVITSEEIGSQYNSLEELLNGKFAVRESNGSINAASKGILDIDGMIFTKDDPIPNIDLQNIHSITIIKSLIGTVQYGTLGRGGVIVIRTKTAIGTQSEKQKPSALVSGNDYIEETFLMNTSATTSLITQLQNAKTFNDAKQIYKTLKQSKDNLSIPFYLETAEYFLKWDESYALDIFTYVTEIANDNAKALKSLAYTYEKLNKLEEARNIYQRIALLRPNDAQSYRDLAIIYNATGYYNEAMQLYKQMLSSSIEGVDFSGLQQPIIDELRHLLAFHRSKVNYNDLPADLLTAKFKQDLRIVFEYNDPNAEFELQFVNPQKKFYKWSHTKFDNRERMLDEIKKGYTTEAYIIDDAESGEWIINIEALNEKPDINPNYLKYTIYKNYGLPSETKTIKVIQLENITQKVTLDKFMYQ